MKTLTTLDAQFMITDFMTMFNDMASKTPNTRMNATIENVGFIDFFDLYRRVRTKNKRLFMPGEYGTETMVMVYTPAPGFIICIESEPCLKVWKGSIKGKNLN